MWHLPLEAGKPHQGEDLAHRNRDVRSLLALHPEPIRHVLEDGQMREERIVLEHEADAAVIGLDASDVPIANEDASRRRLLEACDHAKRRGFAAARWSEQRDEFARLHLEGDIMHGSDRTLHAMLELRGHVLETYGERAQASWSYQVSKAGCW